MANRQVNGEKYAAAIIDTAPSTGGYWTSAVAFIRTGVDIEKAIFSVRGSGTATPILQFRDRNVDSDWTDFYNEGVAFVSGDAIEITSKVIGLEWRAGVKEGGYSSGEITVGINW